MPHHSFHVFCVYPWVGLLGDDRRGGHALTVLDRCRVRWGKVLSLAGDQVVVESRPLTWDGRRLGVGEPETETAVRGIGGAGMLDDLAVGDWVALHWEWVCDRLSRQQLRALQHYTARHVSIVNDAVGKPAQVSLLG